MPRSTCVSGASDDKRRLLEALPPVRLQPRREDDEAGPATPQRDVGDVVLQDLELTNLASESFSRLHAGERVPQHAVEDAEAEAGEDVRSLFSVGSSIRHASPGSPRTSSFGKQTLLRPTAQDPIARMPSSAVR